MKLHSATNLALNDNCPSYYPLVIAALLKLLSNYKVSGMYLSQC